MKHLADLLKPFSLAFLKRDSDLIELAMNLVEVKIILANYRKAQKKKKYTKYVEISAMNGLHNFWCTMNIDAQFDDAILYYFFILHLT